MAKFVNDSSMDAALNWIKTNTNSMSACGTQPTTSTQAGTTYALGTLAHSTSGWVVGDDGSAGRKVTTTAATIPVTANGTINHIAFYNAGTLCAVGTCAPTIVTSGGSVVVAAFDLDKIADIA